MRRSRQGFILVLAATLAGAAVGVAPAAQAHSAKKLAWNELAKVKGNKVFRFEVRSISISKAGWSARVSFHNVSHKTVRVGNVFGLSFFRGPGITPTTHFDAFGLATRFSPGKPDTLAPGASWTGVIQGSGHPRLTGKVYARILFGPFFGVPGIPVPKAYYWVTDHAVHVDLTPGKSKDVLVI